MERSLAILVNRLEKTFGDNLVSIILYGSAASGDFDTRFSDLNVFCVLTRLTPEELFQSEPIFRWWRELGNPAPLLMTEEETRTSADSFPIEFSDMRDRRKVLYGKDVIADLTVDQRYYRAQLEHELRSKLLRLRQQAAGMWTDRDALLKLCLDSVSTFCVLGRHALAVGGQPSGADRREVIRLLAGAVGNDLSPFTQLLDVRERNTAPQEPDPATLFGKYLTSIEAVIRYVDGL
jgi:predicted nucleotidyltransferase